MQKLEVLFLQELEKNAYDPVSRERERELILTYQQEGDLKALQSLVKCNLRFIVDYVIGNANIGMDVVQAAVLGFKRAVKKFDLKKIKPSASGKSRGGYKLITYARGWMRYAIQEYERKCLVVPPSHYARYNSLAIEKIIDGAGNGKMELDTAKASEAGLTQKRIDTALKASRNIIPFELNDEHGTVSHATPHEEAVVNEEIEIQKERNELICGALRLIPSDEAFVIEKRFFGGVLSYRQLSSKLQCSHETVRKIEQRGLDRVKAILG